MKNTNKNKPVIVISPSGKTSKRFLRRFKSFRDIISPMLLGKCTNSFELKSCVEIIAQNKRISNYYCETQKIVKTTNKYFLNVVELQKKHAMICEKTIAQQLVTVISLLILVSASISRSFDSAMLVTTQLACAQTKLNSG